MFLASYIQTLFPKVLGQTIDIMKINGFEKNAVFTNLLYILMIAIGTLIFTFLWRIIIFGNSRKLESYLREKIFRHFLILPTQFYSQRKTGDLLAYSINDISAVRNIFGPALALSVNSIVVCVATIFFMVTTIDLKLSVLTLSSFPIIIIFILWIGQEIHIQFKIVQENFAAISDRVQENIYGIRVIKSFVQEDKEICNFNQLNNNMMDSTIKMVRTSSFLSPVIEICFSFSFVFSLIYGGNLVLNGTISLGDFIAFNTYLTMIVHPVVSIGRIVNLAQQGLASLDRLIEIFNVKPFFDKKNSINQLTEGNIEFRNLSFCYPNSTKTVLENINLKVPNGQTHGIIGKTGSGKSTLANLLFKLYDIEYGKIFLNGKDINEYSMQGIRNHFSYVPQDTFLFSTSIKNNIIFFKDIYSDEEIEKASQDSNIYDSVIRFPDQFNTLVGERGVNLSGGQKQRLAIARSIIKDPSLLILDDALSAVDAVTEAQILKTLKTIRKGKTTLIISHRISAIADADQIIVMENGRICEQGNHRKLLEKGGVYYEIYKDQTKDQKKS